MSTEEDLGSRKPRFWDGGLVAKRVMDSGGGRGENDRRAGMGLFVS